MRFDLEIYLRLAILDCNDFLLDMTEWIVGSGNDLGVSNNFEVMVRTIKVMFKPEIKYLKFEVRFLNFEVM